MFDDITAEVMTRAATGGTYVDFVLRALEPAGDRDAFVHHGRRVSRRQARETVHRMARALSSIGIRTGDSVAVLTANPPEVVLLQLAVHLLGCRYVSVHPKVAVSEQAMFLRDARPTALVYDPRHFTDRAEELRDAGSAQHLLSLGPAAVGQDLLALSAAESAAALDVTASRDDISTVFYTGGTTGHPKLVLHEYPYYGALVAISLFREVKGEATDQERFLLCTPVTHGSGQMAVLLTLLSGGTVVLLDDLDPQTVIETLAGERITTVFLTPPLLSQVLDHPALESTDTSALTRVTYGAAAASPARLAQAIERFGPILRQIYGCTEATMVSLLEPEEHDRPERLSSAGRPIIGMDISIRDDRDQDLPDGEVGEICVRGMLVMTEYVGRPELTAETLRDGWLHTGDLGYLDADGYLYVIGRAKDMIVTATSSDNVYPRTVEDVLVTHPDIAAAAVIGVPDEALGEAVHAVVVARPGRDPGEPEVAAFVRERLGPMYTPRSVQVVDHLPLTALGKVDKQALRAPFWSGRQRTVV